MVEYSGVRLAARNNAEWCDVLCRSHGVVGRFHADSWISPSRTPPLYPDAVTLAAGVASASLLSRIELGPGCSVKDSFADLDLTADGFRVLFRGEWLLRASECARASGWTTVETPRQLEYWESAWGASSTAPRLFRPALLTHRAIAVLAKTDDSGIVAGAIASRSGSVIGLSNVFHTQGDLASAWSDAATAAELRWGSVPVVSYDSGTALVAAREAGFGSIGEMAVWVMTAARPEGDARSWSRAS